MKLSIDSDSIMQAKPKSAIVGFLEILSINVGIFQVLDYYSKKGLVDVTPISLPGYQPNLPVLQHMYLKSKLNNKRQNELIPYNDCLYRNLYR